MDREEDMGTIRVRGSILDRLCGEWPDPDEAAADIARYIEARWHLFLLPYEERGYDLDIDIDTRSTGMGVEVTLVDPAEDTDEVDGEALSWRLEQIFDDCVGKFDETVDDRGVLRDPYDSYLVDDPHDPATLLRVSVCMGDQESVDILLGRGADIHARDDEGRTPLHHAAKRGNSDICAMLLKHGAEVDAVDDRGVSALMLASGGSYRSGAAATVQTLLDGSADPRRLDRDGDRPVDYANVRGNDEIVAVLQAKSAQLDAADLRQRAAARSARPAREAEAAL